MKLYTSYFSNSKTLQKHNIKIIGIALYPPRWFPVVSLRQVAPTYSILKQTSSNEEYTRRYKAEILDRLDFPKLIAEIERLSDGKDVALCCFEKPGEFCHRQLLAERMRSLGYEIEEFEEKKECEQLELPLF